jgi:hypothetical protein
MMLLSLCKYKRFYLIKGISQEKYKVWNAGLRGGMPDTAPEH